MKITALPILRRELRAASRRSGTYWSRFQTALAGLVPTFFLLIGALPAATPAQMGAYMFYALAGLAFLFALLGSVRQPSDSLSSEKREGTLGFLFLTDLKPYDVVLGKLAASSLTGLYGLVALVPILAIPMLCGGVTMADFGRLVLALLNTLFFGLSLAMLVSALCWQGRTAAGMTFLLLFAFGGVLPMALAGAVASMTGAIGWAGALGMPSPVFALLLVPDASYGTAPYAFWGSMGLTHAMSWGFLWTCCRVLPRVWQDRPAQRRPHRFREWYRIMLLGAPAPRAAFRRWALELNPIFWLGSREIRVRWHPWVFLGAMGAIGAFACWALKIRSFDLATLVALGVAFHLFFKHWIATLACHAFSAERDKGALELLLSAPLSVREMLRGHALTLRRIFFWPLALLLCLELAAGAWALSSPGGGDEQDRLFVSLLFATGVVVFVADALALAWIGWWMGVASRNAGAALSSTYFRVFLLPVAGTIVGYVALDVADYLVSGSTGDVSKVVPVVLYVVISVLADWIFGRQARRKLLTELRTAGAERYSGGEPAGAGWRRLARWLAKRRTLFPPQ